ncbi:hypothetical protein OOT46_00175 [Aquabacterium sp. A7-Y]|uniref:hypothetical protein n=1 Tax=Aquabacterium sp. A7-Y TaxID=1349605 RepID=UPI00223CC0BF|nr:hypothetical protein [Aquabacterium sp. A7-Y]MCW7536269.1 hypothetical protein [Aquabacterium sp. A7-Y]
MLDDHAQYGFWCYATLAPGLTWRGRRAWYRQLEMQLQSEGFATGLHRSVMVVLDDSSSVGPRYRYQLVHTLLRDPLLIAIQVGNLVPSLQFDVNGRTGTWVWEATGLPRGLCNQFVKTTLHSIHCGATRASRAKARRHTRGPSPRWPPSTPPPQLAHTGLDALRL